MKLILRDHFRRWWWVWLIGLVGCGGFAFTSCLPDEQHRSSGVFFPLVMFLGSLLLSMDLQRGHARAVLAMPVTPKQIARAWWWASVGIPSLALAVLTVFALALTAIFHGGSAAMERAFIYWLTNSLLLGVLFFALTGIPAKPGNADGWVKQVVGVFFGILWGASFGGWWFFYQYLTPETKGFELFVAIALILTIVGWFRAETLVQERAGSRIGFQASSRKGAKPSRGAEGRGGLPFLVQSTFNRMMLFGLVTAGSFILFFSLTVAPKFAAISTQTHGVVKASAWNGNFPSFVVFQFLWVVALQIIPLCMHLRLLRTLPVSAPKLAAVLVFTPLAAMLVFLYLTGLLVAGASHQPLISAAEVFRQGGGLQLGLAAIFIPMLVWRGWGIVTYLVFIVMIMGGIFGSIFANTQFSSATGGGISLLLIGGAFLATKFTLERSSHAFRPRASQIGGWNWGAGR